MTTDLTVGLNAPTQARAALANFCTTTCQVPIDDILLLTSGIVTNAVLHGCGPITMTVECDQRGIRVEVTDGSPDLAHPVDVDNDDDESGRGLQLVGAPAADWGTRMHVRPDPPA